MRHFFSAQKAAQVNIDEYRVHTAMMEETNKKKEKENRKCLSRVSDV